MSDVRRMVRAGLYRKMVALFNADHDQKSHGARRGVPTIPPPPPSGKRGGSGGSGFSSQEIKGAITGREGTRGKGTSGHGTTYRVVDRSPSLERFDDNKAVWVDKLNSGVDSQRRNSKKPLVRRADGKVMEPGFASRGRQGAKTNHLTERINEGGLREIVDSVGGIEGIMKGKPLWVEKRPTGDGENYIMAIPGTKKLVLNVTVQQFPGRRGMTVKTVMPEPPGRTGVPRREVQDLVSEVRSEMGLPERIKVEY